MRRFFIIIALVLAVSLVGCGSSAFEPETEITVISREEGSGTRGAFVELFGVSVKDETGNAVDMTTVEACITNSTSVVMINVSQNEYAVGYISLGSLNDMVKALKIDGVYPSVNAIQSGEYKISRPFNIAYRDGLSASALDFIGFIFSADGQRVVELSGYVPVRPRAGYASALTGERVVVSGSSSVTPVMEKLKEAYQLVNPNAKIDIQQSDSTTGMLSVAQGLCDIGMSSRGLKQSELDFGLSSEAIALDGIAVIVSPDNPIDGLTSSAVKEIFVSDKLSWAEITGMTGNE